MVSPEISQATKPIVSSEELAERGWRYVEVTLPDGTIKYEMVPLTEAEYLHPQEGYHMPTNTFHTDTIGDARDMLMRHYANDPTVAVFSDLLIIWDDPALEPHSPDVCVVFGVRDKTSDRPRFIVADEGTRPSLIIEVVSPRYRAADRETKFEEYERAAVQEYVIIDRWRRRGQMTYELLGYRRTRGHYRPIAPDEQGRILCRTVGLWLSMREQQLVMEDAQTGERLLSARELAAARAEAESRAEAERQRAEAERQRAEAERQRAEAERQRAEAAEARLAELDAELKRLRGET